MRILLLAVVVNGKWRFSLRAGENRTDIQLACNGGIVSIMKSTSMVPEVCSRTFFLRIVKGGSGD